MCSPNRKVINEMWNCGFSHFSFSRIAFAVCGCRCQRNNPSSFVSVRKWWCGRIRWINGFRLCPHSGRLLFQAVSVWSVCRESTVKSEFNYQKGKMRTRIDAVFVEKIFLAANINDASISTAAYVRALFSFVILSVYHNNGLQRKERGTTEIF